jgi:hypothetical protein
VFVWDRYVLKLDAGLWTKSTREFYAVGRWLRSGRIDLSREFFRASGYKIS